MGVLDDAIRQHLELKRAHGASEEEVRQQEDEALGPVRREVSSGEPTALEDAEAGEVEEGPEAGEEAAVESDLLADESEPAAGAEPYGDESEIAADDEPLSSSAEGLVPAEPPFVEEEDLEEEGYDEPEPQGGTALAEPPEGEGTGEEDAALDAEASPAPLESPGEDDVLDETPDFLQETPEHDRLWFEQRPPRDFDFE